MVRAGRLGLPVVVWALIVAGGVVAMPHPAWATGTFSGTVTDADGAPVAGASIEVLGPWFGGLVASTTTAPDGSYALAVPGGTYRLHATAPGGVLADRFSGGPTGAASWVESGTVTVADGSGATQDLTMYPVSATITGTVHDPLATPLAGIVVEVRDVWGMVIRSGTTSLDGSFSFDVPAPGTYRVKYVDPTGAYGAAFHPGVPTYATASVLSPSPGQSVQASVQLSIAAEVTGSVRVGDRPVPSIAAVVADAGNLELLGFALSDAGGSFRVRGLSPGSYRVLLIDPQYLFGDPTKALRPVVVPGHDVGTEGLITAAMAGTVFTGAAGATVPIGEHRLVGADCDPTVFVLGASLPGAALAEHRLEGCPLDDIDLRDADLTDGILTDTSLDGTDLRDANLTRTDFSRATGTPAIATSTVVAGTICPSGTVTSTACAEWARSFTVTHGGDAIDDDPGDGICHDTGGPVGACSLRAAVGEANATPVADTIDVDPSVTMVTLSRSGSLDDANSTGDLDITTSMTVDANGATIDGGLLDRVIDVRATGALTLTDARVTRGRLTSTSGGGIQVAGGTLHLLRSELTGNTSVGGGGLFVSGGTATVTASTVADNVVTNGGGGILASSGTTLTVTNSTISSNVAGFGGGISSSGATTLVHSTVAANTGSGLRRSGTGTITMSASISAQQETGADCSGTVVSGGVSLDSDGSCGLAGPTDQPLAGVVLYPLADLGATTRAHLPVPGTAAIDAVAVGTAGLCDGTIATDQHGRARPAGAACDAGAVEGEGIALAEVGFVVDDATDHGDGTPGDGICGEGAGTCSLRAAIDEANALPATNIDITLTVDAVLTIAGTGEDANATGDLDTRASMLIDGTGHTIDAAGIDRAFDNRGPLLSLRDVTITGGQTSANGGGISSTAGILELHAADVVGNSAGTNGGGVFTTGLAAVHAGSEITQNTATQGAGIHTDTTAWLLMRDVTVSDNMATSSGGGIRARGASLIERTTLTGNHAGSGGGVSNVGTLVLREATLTLNTAVYGGAVSNGSTAQILDSTLSDNEASEDGGAIHTVHTLTVDGSTISGNRADNDGGGISSSSNVTPTKTLTVIDSTIADNTADGYGGGMYVRYDTLVLRSSTIAGNVAAAGAGVSVSSTTDSTTHTISASTITDNHATSAGGGISTSPNWTSTLAVTSSTIAGNTAPTGAALRAITGSVTFAGSIIAAGEPGSACTGTVASLGHNLFTDTTCTPVATDLVNTNPVLAPLADNGGSTPTRLPHTPSSALDAIPVGTPGLCDGTSPTDQRGLPRPDGAACDIGATEGSGPPLPPLVLVVDDPADAGDTDPGDGACDAGGDTCTLRAAIDEANARVSSDTVTLAVDPVLSLSGAGEDGNATGDVDVTGWLIIDGAGHAVEATGIDRVLDDRANHLIVTDATLTGGTSPDDGGALRNTAGQLDILHSTVVGNSAADDGGGVANAGPFASLRVTGSTISENTAADGGGIEVEAAGSATISASTIVDNSATGAGGGIRSDTSSTSAASRVEIVDSTIARNTATTDGGGVDNNFGSLLIERTHIEENAATTGGGVRTGGYYSYGAHSDGSVTDTTISGNTASGSGGGIFATDTDLTVTASTVSDNEASNAGGLSLDGRFSTYSIARSTVSGNRAAMGTGGVRMSGTFDGPIVGIVSSTIADNHSPATSAITVSGSVSIATSVLSGDGLIGKTCSGSLPSGGFNIASDNSCGLTSPTDQVVTNPLLDDLAENGGPTATRMPHADSPLLDAIPDGTPSLCDGSTQPDQRGVARPFGAACDIGAVEGAAGPSAPLHLVVDDPTDLADALPGDGVCDAGTGTCTLRAAIDESNTTTTSDTITLAVDPLLAIAGTDEDANATGDLDPTGFLVIDGDGHTIDAAGIDRVLDNRANHLTVTDLVVTGGNAIDGGGIRNNTARTFDVEGSTITGNSSPQDGGGAGNVGSMAVMSLTDTTVAHNSASWDGGGILNEDGALRVDASIVTQNTAALEASLSTGGGIDSRNGSVDITGSTISSNTATNRGGGIDNTFSTLRVEGSVVSGNQADEGAGIYSFAATVTVDSSTFASNKAGDGGGGGVRLFDGDVSIVDSTISANTATERGAGIDASSASLTVRNSTISSNSGVQGGGLRLDGVYGSTTISLTTFSGNFAWRGAAIYRAGNRRATLAGVLVKSSYTACVNVDAPLTSGGHNIVSDTSCGLTQATDWQPTSVTLGTLANNGGPTKTHLPAAGGVGIDAIPVGTVELCDGSIATDQRGVLRPQGAACDIGAVER